MELNKLSYSVKETAYLSSVCDKTIRRYFGIYFFPVRKIGKLLIPVDQIIKFNQRGDAE